MIARCMPRRETLRRQAAGERAHLVATCAQVQVCQMPRSFSRKAGLPGRACPCPSKRRGNVCNCVPFSRLHQRPLVFILPHPAIDWRRGIVLCDDISSRLIRTLSFE